MAHKEIRAALSELRSERGWSRERLSHRSFLLGGHGTSVAHISAIERGERRASARTILSLATALGVPAESFPEFRLAMARQSLDEREVGLDEAMRRLEASGL